MSKFMSKKISNNQTRKRWDHVIIWENSKILDSEERCFSGNGCRRVCGCEDAVRQ